MDTKGWELVSEKQSVMQSHAVKNSSLGTMGRNIHVYTRQLLFSLTTANVQSELEKSPVMFTRHSVHSSLGTMGRNIHVHTRLFLLSLTADNVQSELDKSPVFCVNGNEVCALKDCYSRMEKNETARQTLTFELPWF